MDGVDFYANLANINTAMRGGLLSLIEVKLIALVPVQHSTLQTPRLSLPSSTSSLTSCGRGTCTEPGGGPMQREESPA